MACVPIWAIKMDQVDDPTPTHCRFSSDLKMLVGDVLPVTRSFQATDTGTPAAMMRSFCSCPISSLVQNTTLHVYVLLSDTSNTIACSSMFPQIMHSKAP